MRQSPMKPILLSLAIAVAAGVFAPGCSVNFDDDARYVCAMDSDCGGDDYVCVAYPETGGACCRPEGVEACDGKDNDCNPATDEDSACPEPGQHCNVALSRCE